MLIIYSLATWLIISILAISNGIIRNKFYEKKVGELKAHQISTFILIFLIFIITLLFTKIINITIEESWYIGLFWFTLTILFEFIFGHYVAKKTWKELFNDYNILKGRIWSLVLLITLFAPRIVLIFN